MGRAGAVNDGRELEGGRRQETQDGGGADDPRPIRFPWRHRSFPHARTLAAPNGLPYGKLGNRRAKLRYGPRLDIGSTPPSRAPTPARRAGRPAWAAIPAASGR